MTDLPTQETVNIADALSQRARERPFAPAIFQPSGFDSNGRRRYVHCTYRELDDSSDAIGAGLEAMGAQKGDRIAVMVPPGLDFFALVFGLFKAGMVPVLIDPGIGIKPLRTCLAEAEPVGFIGVWQAQLARALFGWARRSLRFRVTVGRGWWGPKLEDVSERGRQRLAGNNWERSATSGDDVAAILFTSGSTGIPKGAIYRHRNFAAQVAMIRRAYDIEPGEVDLPTFPPFALFDPALGMTTVLPEMDFRRPARVNPERIREAIEGFGVTTMFGSPALLNTVSLWAEQHSVRFPTLRRILSAGAPVPAAVLARSKAMMHPDGEIHTPYGATESLPVASVSASEVLEETAAATSRGRGVCVGRPVEPALVRVIAITDEPITSWDDAESVELGQIGEITVQSPTVTTGYWGRPHQTALSKILERVDDSERLVHRMGDVGYIDAQGRVWFCGRKSQRVITAQGPMFTVQVESVFNQHAEVFRSALVGLGAPGEQRPVLCVERLRRDPMSDEQLVRELRALAEGFDITRPVSGYLVHAGFPVDIRHNAKIGRERLARWAQTQRLM